MGKLMDFLYRLHPVIAAHNDDVITLHRLAGTSREAWPQHLGTCRRCNNTYLLGTSCGDPDHLLKEQQ